MRILAVGFLVLAGCSADKTAALEKRCSDLAQEVEGLRGQVRKQAISGHELFAVKHQELALEISKCEGFALRIAGLEVECLMANKANTQLLVILKSNLKSTQEAGKLFKVDVEKAGKMLELIAKIAEVQINDMEAAMAGWRQDKDKIIADANKGK